MIASSILHPLTDWINTALINSSETSDNTSPPYWYEGLCPQTGKQRRLPRTKLAEAIARGLMHQLAADPSYSREGKMYGVLLVETETGEQCVLKAFSGLLQGQSTVAGWVPPIPGRDAVAIAEAHTLDRLEALKQTLIVLQQHPVRQQYTAFAEEFVTQLHQLSHHHQQRKQHRQQQRQIFSETLTGHDLDAVLAELEQQSQRDGIERRHLKRRQNAILQPLKAEIERMDTEMAEVKQQRKQLSRQLQAQLHAHYQLTNFAGKSLPLAQLMPNGSMPTGTGDCCAPKLLHYAAMHGLKPLAIAEFWWGMPSASGDKVPGEFYGACAERCRPLMGFLLSGLAEQILISVESNQHDDRAVDQTVASESKPLPILYEDDWLIAVDKPAGLLSVPGRYRDRQDSVLSRLRGLQPDGATLMAAHRLDQDTSGVLLLARDRHTYCQLAQQFQQRQIYKVYTAILAGTGIKPHGIIDLPLWGNPRDRPRQSVNWQQGKPSTTKFHVLAEAGNTTRVEFLPITGRTHQLRVHAAAAQGLAAPILGDRLYGENLQADRLYLHAEELHCLHPHTHQPLKLHAKTPF